METLRADSSPPEASTSCLASKLLIETIEHTSPFQLMPIVSLHDGTSRPRKLSRRSLDPDEIRIKALDLDNRKDIAKLISLFRSHYGSNHAVPGVFDPVFWTVRNRHSKRKSHLISIVASIEKRFIGHLAYQVDFQARSAQLLFPAIDPEFQSSLFMVIRLFWERISEIARRQQWRAVVTLNPSSEPLQQLIAAKCFGAETTSLLSCRGQEKDDAAATIISMIRPLGPAIAEHFPVYIPKQYQGFAKNLYERMGLQRKFSKAGARETVQFPEKGLTVQTLNAYKLRLIRIRPSEFESARRTSDLLIRLGEKAARKGACPIFQLSLRDPLTPQTAELLEESGYCFSGISPLIMPDDVIVYAPTDFKNLCRCALYTPVARQLRNLICESSPAELEKPNSADSCLSYMEKTNENRNVDICPL